ncbi:MAG: hypothetical protein NTY09_09600 [bacterium]|nr:hypothetical protein [bacterium]
MPQQLAPIIGFLIGFFLIGHIGARFALPRDPSKPGPTFDNLLLGSTTSIAIYSFFMTMLGMSGWFDKCYVITLIIFLLVLILFIIDLINWRRRGHSRFNLSTWAPPDLQSRILMWLLLVFQIGMFINAIAPFINLDCETYHYLFIRDWLEKGRIAIIPDNGYSYYPLAMETTLASAYDIGHRLSNVRQNVGPEAANLGLWFMQVLLMGWLIGFCAKRGKIRVGYLLATAVSGLFYWPVIAYSGDVDGGVTLFALAGVFTYFDWLERRSKPDELPPEPSNPFRKFSWTLRKHGFTQLALAGLFLGTALASKYSALPIAGLVLLHLLWILITDRQHRKRNFCAFIGFIVLMLIPMLPWYGRNIAVTGNPIFPFMRGVFGGPDPAFADDVSTWTGWGLAINFKNFILYPFKLAMFYKLQPPWQLIRIPYMYISWLFALMPIAGILLIHRRIERIVAIWCLVFFTFAFFVMNVQTRYFLPFTILGLWLVCELLESFASARPATELKEGSRSVNRTWVKWLVFVIVLIPFLTQLDLVRNHFLMKWPYLSGQMNRTEYEESVWPSARVFDKADEIVGENEEVVIFSLRSYRLNVPYTLPPVDIFSSGETNSEILQELHDRNENYLLVDGRVMISVKIINYILDNGINVNGEMVFNEDEYLESMSNNRMRMDRDIAREILRHQGGIRYEDAGVWKWRIDLSRYEKPYEIGIFRFLAFIADNAGADLSLIDRSNEWGLYKIK